MPALTVATAELHTVSVEIKTLTVSGKQVTLAVFRQLEDEDVIGRDGHFNGLPWGRVNYCPSKYCSRNFNSIADRHTHVVWQKGSELRRCRINLYDEGFDLSVPRESAKDETGRQYLLRLREIKDLPQLFIAV